MSGGEVLTWVLVVLVSAAVGGAVTLFIDLDFVREAVGDPTEVPISFSDLAALSMTAATLALGSVALIVGVFAAITYNNIRKEAVAKANQSTEAILNERLGAKLDSQIASALGLKLEQLMKDAGGGGALDQALLRAVERVAMNDGRVTDKDLAQDDQKSETER
jgi:hypothetical protein